MRTIGKATAVAITAAVMLLTSPVANATEVEVAVPLFTERVRLSANVVVGQYTIAQFIALIGDGDVEPN